MFITQFFPKNIKKWKLYFSIFVPICLANVLYAFNGFVDNFMVKEFNGIAPITAANQWTSIVLGIGFGTTALGSVISSKLYYSGNYKMFREVSRIRFIFSFGIACVFAISALIEPEGMLKVFFKLKDGAGAEKIQYNALIDHGVKYLRITTLQWILISITSNLADQLSEIGHGKAPLYWSVATLLTNITLNSILIPYIQAEGAAWASVASRIVAFTIGIIYIFKKKLELRYSPKDIFKISRKSFSLFFKNFSLFISGSILIILLTLRSAVYTWAFPFGTLKGKAGAAFILSISNTIFQVAAVSISANGLMAANFVSFQISKGNNEKAKSNSNELLGFNFTIALFTSMFLLILALNIQHFKEILINVDNLTKIDLDQTFEQSKHTFFIFAFFYPFWTTSSTLYRNGVTIGNVKKFVYGDIILNILQVVWAAISMGPIAQSLGQFYPIWTSYLWPSYTLFFMSDFIKISWNIICYKTIDWNKKIKIDPKTIEMNNLN